VLDGKGAVKNLFTKHSHLHYTRTFALNLNYSHLTSAMLIAVRNLEIVQVILDRWDR
jgi:hypothetical protein